MASRTTTLTFLGNTTQLNAAMDAAGLKAEAVSATVGDKMAAASEKAAGGFGKIGQAIQNFTGIPIAAMFQSMSDKMSDADTKGEKLGSTLSSVGKVALAAGAVGFAAVSAESVHLATTFDATVTSIAANSGIPVSAAKKIGDAFLSTAGTTIYSGQQIATAYSQVGGQLKATEGHALDSAQALTVMDAAMDLAEGSGTSLNSATTALSATMQSYHLSVGQASDASDILFNVSKTMDVPIGNVSNAVDKLKGKLGDLAPSLKDTATLMSFPSVAALGSRGIMTVTTSLEKLLGGSKTVNDELNTLGVSVYNSQGKFVGMKSVIEQLQPVLKGQTQAQQQLTLTTLFGSSAAQVMGQVIAGGVPAYDKAAASAGKLGSAHDAAAKQSQTLQHQLDVVGASAQDLGVKFGNFLIPKLEDVIKVVEKVVNWFEKHKAAAEALAGVIGGVLLVAIAAYVVDMGIAAAETIAATWPILLIIAAIALLVIGIVYLSTHWKQVWSDIKKWFDDAVKFLRSGFGDLALLITGPIAPLLFLALHWQAVWSSIRAVVNDVWHSIHNDVFAPLVNFFTDTIPHAVSKVGDVFTSAWHAIDSNFVRPLANFFTGTIPGIISAFVGFFTAIPGEINHVWSDVVNALHAAWSAVANWVQANVVQPVVNFFTGIPGAIDHIWHDVVNAITSAWATVAGWVYANVILPVVNFFAQIPGAISHVWHDVVNAITSAWATVAGWVFSNVVLPVINFFAQIPGAIDHVWHDVVNAITSAWSTISGWVNSNVIQPVINFFADIPGRVSGIASQVWSDFTSGIGSLASWVNGNVVQPIVGFFTGLPGKIAGIGSAIVQKIVSEISGAGNAILGAIKSIIPGPLQSVVSSALGFLASGGPATAGMPYIIGEQGPELFIPSTSGVVVPNNVLNSPTLGGGALSVVNPVASGGSASGPAQGGAAVPLQVELTLDGVRFATAIVPDLRTALYTTGRAVGSLDFN